LSRERNREWCAEHRSVTRRNAWLAGAPPFASHLPGVTMSIAVAPAPKWPIALRNARGLHGAMTAILDVGHQPRFATFAMRQTDLAPTLARSHAGSAAAAPRQPRAVASSRVAACNANFDNRRGTTCAPDIQCVLKVDRGEMLRRTK
jgi:hypothetical protein